MTIKADIRTCPVVVKAIIQDGRLYQMEYKEHQNALFYIILKLHSMGAPNEQLAKVYNMIIESMKPLIVPKIFKIQKTLSMDDWQDYLGDKDMYSAYLEFFDRKIMIYGIQQSVKQFFYESPLAQSIGSQRLPTVHLALGLQHQLPEILGQALAYMAVSYHDASFLLNVPFEIRNSGYLTAHEILMEQVKVDPRFSSFPVTPSLGYGQHTDSTITYRKILKNTKELLRTYVYLWRVPEQPQDALNELRVLAAHMMIKPVTKSVLRKYYVDLGTGGNLLNTMNVMNQLYPGNSCSQTLIRVQFLNLICSYIVQGRPDILPYTHHSHHQKHNFTTKRLLNKDVKTMSALFALQEAQEIDPTNSIFNKVMSIYLQ